MIDLAETKHLKEMKHTNFQEYNLAIEKLEYQREDILGLKCEITREVYNEMLSSLPPFVKRLVPGFYMTEMLSGRITYHFYPENDKFYCVVEELSEEDYVAIQQYY